MKAGSDRTKLEKDVMASARLLLRKRRLLSRIAHVVPRRTRQTGYSYPDCCEIRCQRQDIDLVVDANAVAYNSSDVKTSLPTY